MALARLWRWLWRRPVSVAAKKEPDEDGSRRAAARARFWAELREGQRQAEASSSNRAIYDDPRHAAGAVPSTGGRTSWSRTSDLCGRCFRRSWMTAPAAPTGAAAATPAGRTGGRTAQG